MEKSYLSNNNFYAKYKIEAEKIIKAENKNCNLLFVNLITLSICKQNLNLIYNKMQR